ncbi:MAG TPA: LysM peptidoglycan-binding domain-containing protein [Chloroflexota bacterium]|nr:LysM peptidoglycan-binding domain-containing protein [Chloroflexota bacterium]
MSLRRVLLPAEKGRTGWSSRLRRPSVMGLVLAVAALAAMARPALAAPGEAAGGGFRVVVDAGHGGQDPGAISPFAPLVEKDVVLRVALLTGAALERRGIAVTYTRTGDQLIPLSERAALAQRSGAQALLSLHLNSAPDPSVSGVEAWYGSGVNHAEFAATVLAAMAPTLRAHGVPVRGTRSGPQLAVLRTPVPATLVELGYVSHARDAGLLAQPRFLENLAEALAAGVARFRETRGAVATAPNRPAFPDVYFVRQGDTLQSIAERFRLAAEELIRLNPLTDPLRLLPGHPVQLRPSETLVAGWTGEAPTQTGGATRPARRQISGTYTVMPGDTLSEIALATGVDMAELMRLNGLSNAHSIRSGQTLRLRAGDAPTSQAGGAARTHTVAAGDTLSEIAARYGVSAADLARWNDLSDQRLIRVGQQLRLAAGGNTLAAPPAGAGGGSAEGRQYRLQPGDTLSEVAVRHGVTLEALLRANPTQNPHRVLAGTTLLIPAAGS